jgi:hypothetical protein
LHLRDSPQAPPKLDPEIVVCHHDSDHLPLFTMDLHEAQNATLRFFTDANAVLERIPGSAIAVRYIKSSYQNDPVRSAIELFLFLFAVRYLLAPKYSTQKKVQLTDAVCRALVVGRRCADVGIGDRRTGRGLDARTARCTADST